MTIESKFSLNDRAYYIIFATTSINAVEILKVYAFGTEVFYNVRKVTTGAILERVPEKDLYNFTDARLVLKKYLEDRLREINGLVAP